ncbi:hypothetical protein FKM82_029395 [Ascaphus truei]
MLGIPPEYIDKRMNGFKIKQVCDITRVKKLKWQWARPIARRNYHRWTKMVFDWIRIEIKRPRRLPKATE